MGNLFLVLTILAETGAVIYMKLSAGFQHTLYTIIAFVLYGLSFLFLTLALKYLPTGIANAIWAGASTILVVLLGVLIFKEKLSILQIVSLMLVVAGLVGLNWKS